MFMRILIADDHAIVRRGIKAILESIGYEVSEAADGREAIQRVKECDPEVLILDITMPIMSGLDAARVIRRERPELPIVLLSMHSLESQKLAAQSIGINGFVSKSRAARDLVAAIETVKTGGSYFAP